VTPQHVPLTALETFLAENPGLKPFLLAGPAKERAVIESAIAWAEMCDHVYHLIRPQVCGWRTGLLGILRSRMTKRGSLRNSATPHESAVEASSLIDSKADAPSYPDNHMTFGGAESFGREFMPFCFFFGERFNEKWNNEMYLEDLQMKAEDEKVSIISSHLRTHMTWRL
jgi:hypothetical protein